MNNEYDNPWRRLRLPIALLVATVFPMPLAAQVCNTSGAVTLSSQAQVASFQTDYGPCTSMSDNLTVSGADITDLGPLGLTAVHWLKISNNPALTSIDGLSTITSAGAVFILDDPLLGDVDGLSGLSDIAGGGGHLQLMRNAKLADLGGLSGITSLEGNLAISDNALLSNLDDLANLTSTNDLSIANNPALSSISGLSNLTSVGAGGVLIHNNPSLVSLVGLSNLTTAGGPGLNISYNTALTDLDPLSGITSVTGGLGLHYNDNLVDVTGLGNVQGVGYHVEILGNTSLSQCSILARLLDQVDDFAPGPGPGSAGIPDVGDDVTIGGNLLGCNSVPEIVGGSPLSPKLTISKSASQTTFIVGQAASYTITVTNTGTAATTADTIINDIIPAGLTIGTMPTGCTNAGQAITCTISNPPGLAAGGGTASFIIPVTPTVSASNGNNTAYVTGGGDPNCTGTNCAGSVNVSVNAPPPPPGPPSIPVPTLAGWACLLLILIMLGGGLIGFRRKL